MRPKGYGFSAVLVINRVSILADFAHFGHKFCFVAMLYMNTVNSATINFTTFTKEELFELIGTAGRTFSFMQAADGFADAGGTELCKGNVEEIADIELDCAGTYPLAKCFWLYIIVPMLPSMFWLLERCLWRL